uniref:Uncharacterized protein n=1 Tax=Sphaerodactylus townsendi TaxID=933632 RepID=A0ACB8ECP8_9SAUR
MSANTSSSAVPPKLKKLKSLSVEVGAKVSLKWPALGIPSRPTNGSKDGKELKRAKASGSNTEWKVSISVSAT